MTQPPPIITPPTVTPEKKKGPKITYIWMPDKDGNLVKADSSIIKKSFAKLPTKAVLALQGYLTTVEKKANPTRAQRENLWNDLVDAAVAAFAQGQKQSPWDILDKLIKTTPESQDVRVSYTEYDKITSDALLDKIAKAEGFDSDLLTDEDRNDFLKKLQTEAKSGGKTVERKTKAGLVEVVTTPSVFDAAQFARDYIWTKVNIGDPNTLPDKVVKQVSTIRKLVSNYGLKTLTDKEINQFSIDIATGKMSIEDLQNELTEQAAVLYPQYADRLRRTPGLTVKDLVAPTIKIIADAWEVDPDTLDFTSPEMDKLIRPDGTVGKMPPLNSYETYLYAVNHPNREKTIAGNMEARDAAVGLARAMGFGV